MSGEFIYWYEIFVLEICIRYICHSEINVKLDPANWAPGPNLSPKQIPGPNLSQQQNSGAQSAGARFAGKQNSGAQSAGAQFAGAQFAAKKRSGPDLPGPNLPRTLPLGWFKHQTIRITYLPIIFIMINGGNMP